MNNEVILADTVALFSELSYEQKLIYMYRCISESELEHDFEQMICDYSKDDIISHMQEIAELLDKKAKNG